MVSGFFLGGMAEGMGERQTRDLAERAQSEKTEIARRAATLAERVQGHTEGQDALKRATEIYNGYLTTISEVVKSGVAVGRDPQTIMRSIGGLVTAADSIAPAAGMRPGSALSSVQSMLGLPGHVETKGVEGLGAGAKAVGEQRATGRAATGEPVPISPVGPAPAGGGIVAAPPVPTFNDRFMSHRPDYLPAPPAATDPTMTIRPAPAPAPAAAAARATAPVPVTPAPAAPAPATPPGQRTERFDATQSAYPFPDVKAKLDHANKLSDDHRAATKSHSVVDDYNNRVKIAYEAKHTGTSDNAMIFSFIKMLDATSTVSPGEQQSMKQAASYIDQLKLKYWDKITNSWNLPPEVRKDIADLSTAIHTRVSADKKKVDEHYATMAKRAKIDPVQVVPGYAGPRSDFENTTPGGIGFSIRQ